MSNMNVSIPKSVLYKLVSEYKIKYDNSHEINGNINTYINYCINDWVLIFKYPNIINFHQAEIGQIINIDTQINNIHTKFYVNTKKNTNLSIYKNNINAYVSYENYLSNLLLIRSINKNKIKQDMLKITNLVIKNRTNKNIIWD